MQSDPYLSVILPAHNEERRIDACLHKMLNYLWSFTNYKFEVIVVANGCTDTTQDIVMKWQEDWPQVRIITIPEAGKGLAVRTGMLAAHGTYRYMADVDLATPPDELHRFLISAQAGGDLVIGYRSASDIGLTRLISHEIWRMLTSAHIPGIHDSQCGFKIFSADAAMKIFPASRLNGYAFDVELLMLARQYRLKIVQMPVPWKDSGGSKVHIFRDSWKMARELLSLRVPPSVPITSVTRQA